MKWSLSIPPYFYIIGFVLLVSLAISGFLYIKGLGKTEVKNEIKVNNAETVIEVNKEFDTIRSNRLDYDGLLDSLQSGKY